MSLRSDRNDTARAILEGKFVRKVLAMEGKALDDDINKTMAEAGFASGFWHDKTMTVTGSGNTLEYRHKKQHRFVDMKTRDTKRGTIRKKNHRIHNRKVFGHLNEIARELAFGFTNAVIEEVRALED